MKVLERARWPHDEDVPQIPGFVHSSFSPLVAAVADRCLTQRYGERPATAERTAVVLVTSSGDRASAEHVAHTVATGGRPGPLFFFQSVPNSVAGYVAARWGLRGPVVCVSPAGDPLEDGLAQAELLIEDGSCDEALVVLVEQSDHDTAEAVLVRGSTGEGMGPHG